MADKKEKPIFDLDTDLSEPFKEIVGKGEIDGGFEGLDPIKKGQENLFDAGEKSNRRKKRG